MVLLNSHQNIAKQMPPTKTMLGSPSFEEYLGATDANFQFLVENQYSRVNVSPASIFAF